MAFDIFASGLHNKAQTCLKPLINLWVYFWILINDPTVACRGFYHQNHLLKISQDGFMDIVIHDTP